jgi:hypothetical protein
VRILHGKLGLKEFHLHWVLPALSVSKENENVLSAKLILTALPEHEVSHFEQVIMADK